MTGWWVEPRVFSDAECDHILSSVGNETRSRAGVRHLMSNPCVAAFARDERLLAIARTMDAEEAKLEALSVGDFHQVTNIWPYLAYAEAKTGDFTA